MYTCVRGVKTGIMQCNERSCVMKTRQSFYSLKKLIDSYGGRWMFARRVARLMRDHARARIVKFFPNIYFFFLFPLFRFEIVSRAELLIGKHYTTPSLQ